VSQAIPVERTASVANAVKADSAAKPLAKKEEALPTASEGESSRLSLFWIAAGAVGAGLFCSYQLSGTANLRRRLRSIRADFEGAREWQRDLVGTVQRSVEGTARDYRNDIVQQRLAAISTDEIRKVVSGARLQPLRERGVTNLLLCQGWTASRLISLHGIGPDSAAKIELAIVALTKAVSVQNVPHPTLEDGRILSLKLFRDIYIFFEVHTRLGEQPAALEKEIGKLEADLTAVLTGTSFWVWLLGLTGGGPLKRALQAGGEIEARTKSDAPSGVLLKDCKAQAVAVGAFMKYTVSAATMGTHVAANREYYVTSFEKILGPDANVRRQAEPAAMPPPLPTKTERAAADEPVRVRDGVRAPSGFSIRIEPDQPQESSAVDDDNDTSDCWRPAGSAVTLGPFEISGGLLYVGQGLRAIRGDTVEPALINPRLPVAVAEADCRVRMLNYWSSYSFATPAARASYLQWLGTGKCDPAADVGYVFLYFYGLERRLLSDSHRDQAARAETAVLLAEVHRLRGIYAGNGSFNRYSSELLEYVEFSRRLNEPAATDELPPLQQYHLSFALRRKLGQLAVAGLPLPSAWAYAWYYSDPRTRLPAAAFRCPDEASRLFQLEYGRRFGAGLVLPANKTRLKLTYRPASPSFGVELSRSLELPDVGLLSTSYGKLESVGGECFRQLDSYSRLLGRNKSAAQSFEGMLLLPPSLWPEARKEAVAKLRVEMADMGPRKFKQLLEAFGQQDDLNRREYLGLCRALNAAGIGLEPDPRFGTEIPELDEPVVIFPIEEEAEPGDGFGLAALLLRLSATVAAADGEFSEREADRIRQQIDTDRGLRAPEKMRLLARLALFRSRAPLLTGLKPTIAALASESRRQIVDFLVSLVYADCEVNPAEVKVMEKIYGLFDLDAGVLYTRLHELSAGAVPARSEPAKAKGPIRLDAAKVRQLRAASEEVTQKLQVIFAEPEVEEPLPKEPESAEEGMNPQSRVLDLDQAHADLVVVLIGRMTWARPEFEELCADKGLMPDGAIERINEAAFQKFDQAIIEGDDPLEIAVKLVEEALHAPDHPSQRP
jgi:uncharacterized tellurite resistance protein B-like protein